MPLHATHTQETVVLLHSLGASAEMWLDQVEALRDRFRVLTPDSLGHGDSTKGGPISVNSWVQDLVEFIEDRSGVPVHLVGLSMGGIQSLGLAQRHPGLVKSLTLANTFAVLNKEAAQAKIEQIEHDVRVQGMEQYATTYLDATLTQDIPGRRRETLRRAIASVPTEAYLDSARATFTADLSSGLADISVPTQVITSDSDFKTPKELSLFMQRQIAGASLVTIPGAGHLSNMEQPRIFTAHVETFILSVANATPATTLAPHFHS
jgi:3-oxoadipate enol-lactonase